MSGWISVEERLPLNGQRVIVFAKSKLRDPHISICTFYQQCREDMMREKRSTPRQMWSRGIYEVTHWMPLPEPPKEG